MKLIMQRKYLFTWILILSAILTTVLAYSNLAVAQSGSNDATKAPTILLIDVRTPAEFSKDGVKSAINIPYDKISKEIKTYTQGKKDIEIKLYCRSGRRSGIALKTLEQLGYTNVTNLGDVNAAKTFVKNNPIKSP